MRAVVISCDRCGKEIAGCPVRIMAMYADRESEELYSGLDEEFPDSFEKIRGRDFCEKCAGKIARYAMGGIKEHLTRSNL